MIDRFVGSRRRLFGNAGRGIAAGLFARLPVASAPRTETNLTARHLHA
jgi:hypothetical protein